jgi:hypothetical protein
VKISAKEIEGRKIPPMKKRRPSTIFQVSKILKWSKMTSMMEMETTHGVH